MSRFQNTQWLSSAFTLAAVMCATAFLPGLGCYWPHESGDSDPHEGDDAVICDDDDPPIDDDTDIVMDDDDYCDFASCSLNVTFVVTLVDVAPDLEPALNAVEEGEDVYIVGNFTSWCPNFDGYQMEWVGDSTYELTLEFPHDGYEWSDPCGQAPKTFNPGDTLEFKFAKTTSDPDSPWAEGQKMVALISERPCPAAEGQGEWDAVWGLWEVANFVFTIPTGLGSTTIAGPYEVEAWRDTADAIPGVATCD